MKKGDKVTLKTMKELGEFTVYMVLFDKILAIHDATGDMYEAETDDWEAVK